MGALTGLWNSEKGLLGLTLIIAATVLVALGHMSIDQWSYFTGAIYGAYAVTKTVQGALAKPAAPTAEIAVAPTPPVEPLRAA